ncbi:MotA/TolQ/ExbB proton channel family protein [Wenzhouxiangella sediminis]|jgi:biopolymer transport protein ExbB|uniref:MotA/TolQ/ExbB proton channel family protein n=1 Tax=Wenzhouxiangella sediminis TaxID=1792836 RepID=A0A3E1KAS8_9GAMM|nr:MotA/TolQ/ExbB proton channel family protein [Wenzhouxiangella sediminis]RFF31549.1 MotA/TolQ/ExbB proton channel family protein [Wenzhouxiangella sediminis]
MLGDLLNDFATYFELGGYVMPPLVLATVVLWFAIGYRFAALKRGNVRSVRRIIQKHPDGFGREPRGVIEKAIEQGISIGRSAHGDLRRLLDDAFWPIEREVSRFHKLIMTIVAVAPLMGLLGTVVGMIETFDSLGDMSLFAQSGGIAGGISQALFTTQMGLAVAIPGLIVGGLLERRAAVIRLELAQVKDILCARAQQGSPV